ncbi:MAG: replicative DNA helicase [Calditrichaeota bacterium]|jgi:replicative DNA helicase|nr:replicative DNA helicase [Calditrichota bacterium]MBT7617455.1 replicative DNA helicase [Calditrichota bacterium]MBT7787647.1 replicative DNA helicase [Calditrichota bacterium]
MADSKKEFSNKKKKPVDLLGGRVPPHNLEMERAVLCSSLVSPSGFARVVDFVDDSSFYDNRHKLIFAAMARLFSRGAGIDLLTVNDELAATDDSEAAGGVPYLAGLTNEVATAAHAEQYAKTVREKYGLRRLIATATSMAVDAYEAPEAIELLDQFMPSLFEIYSNRSESGYVSVGDSVTEAMEYLDNHHKLEGELTGIGTGFDELDEYTSGFQAGDLVIIAARPSMGKTAFSLDLARNAAQMYNKGIAFFSLEMSSMAISMRILASEARVDLHRLRSGRLQDHHWAKLARASSTLSESNFFIDDTGNLGLMELRARARQLKQQHNIDMLFIDYLQLMKPPKAESRVQEVAQISRGLKGLARELEIPVIALSQLSRAVEQRGGDKRPVLSDLRDSGSIEQDADVVMFIYREAQYQKDAEDDVEISNIAEILIRKQRNGPTGKVELTFIPEHAKFENKSDRAAIEAARSFAGASNAGSSSSAHIDSSGMVDIEDDPDDDAPF